MTMLLAGESRFVAEWVARSTPFVEAFREPYEAIGIVKDDQLIGGLVFTDYDGTNVCLSIAGHTGWITREVLRECFTYAFESLDCRRVTCQIHKFNKESRRLCERVGFKQEGTLRQFFPDGAHCILYGMLKKECRWING